MRPQSTTVEQELARMAGREHGVVTRAELLRAGISAGDIKRRLRKGVLIPEHPGVYRVGHRVNSVEARYTAAVKACGEGAVLCGRAAGHLLGFLKGRAPAPEVMTPAKRRIKGIRIRRSRSIDRRDATTWRGIPVTTVPRTLVDLAPDLPANELARAVHEAGVRHGTKPHHVEAVLERRPTSPGAGKLRKVMYGDEPVTLSELERAFLGVLKQAGLSLPQTNRHVDGRYVDCRWPKHKLTVELDSYRFHNSRYAWEQDRRRAREAYARGDDFRRYTYQDVFEDKGWMLSELRALLAPERPARS